MTQHAYVAPGQSVQLSLGTAGTLNAHVDAILEDRMLLVPLAKLPIQRHRIVGVAADAEVATPRGVWRASGVITSCDEGERLEIGFHEEPSVDQRREYVRLETRLPGLIVSQQEEGPHSALHTFTLDVSGAGVLVAGAGTEPIGTPVKLQVKLPDRVLETDAVIARRTPEGHVGLRFTGISTPQREALIQWIFERQRLARAAERRREG
ncbi:MAG TPA: PilZ domain-containing protein [Solirubrobacteraceae bacterium]|nr:PilZ domain-containing protein [Solirubrobacteraceae bacterium]